MKKNIIIILLILTNIGLFVYGFAQRTIVKFEYKIANQQIRIANQFRISVDSVHQILLKQQNTIDRQDSLITEYNKLLKLKK
jgi:hypothetical protein